MRCRPEPVLAWIAVIVGVLTLRASAGIVLVSDDRSLSISGGPQGASGFSDSVSSGGALVFNRQLDDQAVDAQGFGGYAHAEQNSTLTYSSTVLSFVADGLTRGGTYPNSYTPGGRASGTSQFALTFRLDAPATYHLDVTRDQDSISGNTAGVLLYNGSTKIAGLAYPSQFFQQSFDGTLDPGTYSLQGNSGGVVGPDLWHNSFSTNFTVSSVPLPPAVWAVVVWLPGGVVMLLAFERRARKARFPGRP